MKIGTQVFLLLALPFLAPVGASAQTPSGAPDAGAEAKIPTPPGTVEECPWGISKEMTERLGHVVEKDFPAQSRCKYTGILTQKTVLELNWTLDGKAELPLRVSTRQCMVNPPSGNEQYVLEVPDEMPKQCPETATFLANFRGALGKEIVFDGNANNPRQKRPRPYGLLALVVAVAIGLILWRRSREQKPEDKPTNPS